MLPAFGAQVDNLLRALHDLPIERKAGGKQRINFPEVQPDRLRERVPLPQPRNRVPFCHRARR